MDRVFKETDRMSIKVIQLFVVHKKIMLHIKRKYVKIEKTEEYIHANSSQKRNGWLHVVI